MIVWVLITCAFIAGYDVEAMNATKRVCVLGAGLSGLNSARYLKAEGINFIVLEATNYVGGTWRYDEKIGRDEYGQPIFTSMYKNLRTNLPRPTMELPDFPFPEETPSYPPGHVFYNYLESFAEHFDLKKYIKFSHAVTSVKRVANVWNVQYKHLPTGKEFEENFDYVIVATGHHSKGHMPNITGENIFRGSIIHSHDYRTPDPYKSRRVLIVGIGPSGMDIGIDISNLSKTLIHSHHSKINHTTPFPPHYIMKPDIKEFNETGATFTDGTFEEIDDVIYCTGYEYDLPFLDESCGLTIFSRYVVPLYKHIVNINQPTMLFLGAMVKACFIIASDAQARYAAALIKGNFTLPPQKDMMQEYQKKVDELILNGRPLAQIHLIGEKEDEYYADLTRESGIRRVPPVMCKIRFNDMHARFENLFTYRNYAYKIIDSETFTRTLIGDELSNNSTRADTL